MSILFFTNRWLQKQLVGELWIGFEATLFQDKPRPLTPKVFDTLLILVENSGRIVNKEELMSRLWPDTFVEEANLTSVPGLTSPGATSRIVLVPDGSRCRIAGDDASAPITLTRYFQRDSKRFDEGVRRFRQIR